MCESVCYEFYNQFKLRANLFRTAIGCDDHWWILNGSLADRRLVLTKIVPGESSNIMRVVTNRVRANGFTLGCPGRALVAFRTSSPLTQVMGDEEGDVIRAYGKSGAFVPASP